MTKEPEYIETPWGMHEKDGARITRATVVRTPIKIEGIEYQRVDARASRDLSGVKYADEINATVEVLRFIAVLALVATVIAIAVAAGA